MLNIGARITRKKEFSTPNQVAGISDCSIWNSRPSIHSDSPQISASATTSRPLDSAYLPSVLRDSLISSQLRIATGISVISELTILNTSPLVPTSARSV